MNVYIRSYMHGKTIALLCAMLLVALFVTCPAVSYADDAEISGVTEPSSAIEQSAGVQNSTKAEDVNQGSSQVNGEVSAEGEGTTADSGSTLETESSVAETIESADGNAGGSDNADQQATGEQIGDTVEDATNDGSSPDQQSVGDENGDAVKQIAVDGTTEEATSPENGVTESADQETAAAEKQEEPAPVASTAAAAVTAKATAKTSAKKAPVAKVVKAGWYSFATILNSKYRIEVKNSGSKTGTKLRLRKDGAATGQAFKLVKRGNYWRIMSGVGFKSRVTMDSDGNVFLSTSNGKVSLFKLVANKDGSYRLVNAKYKMALTIQGGKAKKNAYLVGAKSKASNKAQGFNLVSRKGILKDGIYSMRTWLNSKYAVAPKKDSLSAGAQAALVKYGANIAEKWQVKAVAGRTNTYTLECIATGYRLTGSGTNVTLAAANNAKSQMWKLVGTNGQVMWKNLATKKILQVNSTKAKANYRIIGAKSTKDDNQRFTMKSANVMGSGFYELTNGANGTLALEVTSGSESDGTVVQVATDKNTAQQRWYYDNSSKTLSNANFGKLLTAKNGKISSGVALVQARSDGSNAQKWVFQYMGGGKFRIVSKANAAIAVAASGTKSGADAKLAKASSTMKQRWTVRADKPSITTTKQLKMTLNQMIKWQRAGNPYISDYTTTQLKKVLDPANCNKYQFLDLRKSAGATAAQLDAFINTYGSKGKLKGLGAAFVSAGKTYKVNEVYLLAHAILESGWGSSPLANGYKYSGGTIDGKKYKAGTYYNFYGIGAYDSSPLSGGRKSAIINGWNTPSKAVTGAAKWIANNYVYASSYPQYTLYNMKWDTDRSNATQAYGWHQYATSPDWAQSIASLMESCFKLVKTTGSLSYIKPVYK